MDEHVKAEYPIPDYANIGLEMLGKFSDAAQYHCYSIAKKSGGRRQIEAPNDELKLAQKASLRRIDRLLKYSHFAHAFARERNIASGAGPHVGAETVLTADLSDFFPSIKWQHFDPDFTEEEANANKQPWQSRSYKTPMSFVFGSKKMAESGDFMKLYHEKVMPEIKMHFCDFGDGKGLRLPQGSPASPFLSNVLLCRFDYRAGWKGYPEKVEYTRYADDLIFSGPSPEACKRVYAGAVALLTQLGLDINKRKYQLKTGNQRKKVLGLVVNALPPDHPRYDAEKDKARTTRYFRRRLRAMHHHCHVISTLYALRKERGFTLCDDVRPYLMSKTEGMSFGDKMRSVVDAVVAQGGQLTMEDLSSKNLIRPEVWYSKKVAGYTAFQHMVDHPPTNVQSSLDYCAVQEMLAQV